MRDLKQVPVSLDAMNQGLIYSLPKETMPLAAISRTEQPVRLKPSANATTVLDNCLNAIEIRSLLFCVFVICLGTRTLPGSVRWVDTSSGLQISPHVTSNSPILRFPNGLYPLPPANSSG